jgi:hypothetical protein
MRVRVGVTLEHGMHAISPSCHSVLPCMTRNAQSWMKMVWKGYGRLTHAVWRSLCNCWDGMLLLFDFALGSHYKKNALHGHINQTSSKPATTFVTTVISGTLITMNLSTGYPVRAIQQHRSQVVYNRPRYRPVFLLFEFNRVTYTAKRQFSLSNRHHSCSTSELV